MAIFEDELREPRRIAWKIEGDRYSCTCWENPRTGFQEVEGEFRVDPTSNWIGMSGKPVELQNYIPELRGRGMILGVRGTVGGYATANFISTGECERLHDGRSARAP